MKRDFICIICPRGCCMTADIDGETITVTGNSCPKGAEYARNECLNPVRTVTSSLRIANRCDTMISVKTEKPVPKDKMHHVIFALRKVSCNAPVCIGDVILEDICGTRIIATKAVL